jgi:hypothetical protein
MRPRIRYETVRKMEALVNELRMTSSEMSTDEQVTFLIEQLAGHEYGPRTGRRVPPWKRKTWDSEPETVSLYREGDLL